MSISGKLIKTPVYQQLNELLRELIRSGEFKLADRFLTERQIAERFEVSRATANKALSNLVSEGLLEFRKGLGTFVQDTVLDVDLRLLVSFTARAEARGKKPVTRVLRFAKRKASEVAVEIGEKLRLGPDDPVFDVERVRIADGVPVIYEKRVIAARHCPHLDETSARGSLYALWTDKMGLEIGGAEQTIHAVSVGTREAEVLAVKRGTAGLLVRAVGYLAGGVPLWWEETLYRGDVYEFTNRLGLAASHRAGRGAVLDLVKTKAAK